MGTPLTLTEVESAANAIVTVTAALSPIEKLVVGTIEAVVTLISNRLGPETAAQIWASDILAAQALKPHKT